MLCFLLFLKINHPPDKKHSPLPTVAKCSNNTILIGLPYTIFIITRQYLITYLFDVTFFLLYQLHTVIRLKILEHQTT